MVRRQGMTRMITNQERSVQTRYDMYSRFARIDGNNKPTRVCVQANLARPDMLCEVSVAALLSQNSLLFSLLSSGSPVGASR